MRRCYILLLVFVGFLSGGDAGLTTTSSKLLTGNQGDNVSKRILKSETAVDKDDSIDSDDERGIFEKIKNLYAKVKSKIKSGRPTKLPPTDLKLRLGVETKFLSLYRDTPDFLSNPKFKTWGDYAASLYRNDPEQTAKAMLDTLTKHYDELTLTRWALEAKSSKEIGHYGNNLLSAQFFKFMDERVDVRGLEKKLLPSTMHYGVQRDEELLKAFRDFIKKVKPD